MSASIDAQISSVPRMTTAFRIPVWFGIALAASLLMLRQPYAGVRHDALLYLGQALARLDPSWASHDFYFQYGSQDSFSLFSRLFIWPVQVFGIGPTEIGTLIFCRTLALLAVYWLAKELTPRDRWLAVLAAACVAHFYGAARVFSVLEPFVTARTPAEPLALLGFAALLRGRVVLSAIVLLVAAACHPLLGLPALVVAWAYLVFQDRRWAWACVSITPVLALAALGVAPFNALLALYDEKWFAVIANANPNVFITLWDRRDFTAAFLDLWIIWTATRGRAGPLARLSRAAMFVAPSFCIATLVCSDLVHDVLLTQIQLWRALWITNVLAAVWMPSLVLAFWQRDSRGRLAAIALATAVFAASDWAMEGWALAAWALVTWQVCERQVSLKASIVTLATVATVLVAIGEAGQSAWSQLYQIAMLEHGTALMHSASIPFTWSIAVLPLAGWVLWARGQGRYQPMLDVAIVALVLGAVIQFDQRPALRRFSEDAPASERPFQSLIPKTATVYWENAQLGPVWLLLGRAGFAQEGQFSGVMFNRGTAAVAMDRLPIIAHALDKTGNCEALRGWMQSRDRFRNCEDDESVLRSVCTAKTSHADFFVSQARYSIATPVSAWRFDPRDGSPAQQFRLYDCRTVPPQPATAPAVGASAPGA